MMKEPMNDNDENTISTTLRTPQTPATPRSINRGSFVDGDSILIDANEAARMCSMHRASWYKAVSCGKVPAGIRIGGMVRWRRDELLAWIDARCPPRVKWEALFMAPTTKTGKRR